MYCNITRLVNLYLLKTKLNKGREEEKITVNE